MLLKLSRIKDGIVYRKPTIFFETQNKNKDNLIIIPALDEQTMINVLNSDLIRGENIKSIYTPFRTQPMNRKRIITPLKEYYQNIYSKTNNKFNTGRKVIGAYQNKNLVYDINVEWRQTIELASKLRGDNPKTYSYISQYLFTILNNAVKEAGYINNILVVPFDGSIKNFTTVARKKSMLGDAEVIIDPATIFTRIFTNWEKGTEGSILKGISTVVFYNINADALIKIDLTKPDHDAIKSKYAGRIIKLYNMKGNAVGLFDEDEVASDEETVIESGDREIKAEQKFETVVSEFYKRNKIKGVEVAPDNDIQDNIYMSMVDKIKDKVVNNKDIEVEEILSDPEVSTQLTRYAAVKKKEVKVNTKNAENTEAEIDLLYDQFNKLPKIDFDKQNEIEYFTDEEALKDPRLAPLASTPIAALSKEYIDKQFRDDILKVASSLSSNPILPLTLHDIEFIENSDYNNQLYKLRLKYKANINGSNKDITVNINIPKIVDNHFMFINGNRWTVDNQLAFLPVTKTASDLVKITTNYSILFIERQNGYISKVMNQVLRLLKEDERKDIEVKYGDNSVSYSKNNLNHIEYSEISKQIYSIDQRGKYKLFFNYDDLAAELKLQGVPEKYWKFPEKLIPIGFKQEGNEDKILFLFGDKVYTTDFKLDTLVSNSLSELIYEEVYGTTFDKLPGTSSRMGYNTIKIAGSHYPLILILGMIYGLKNTMNRYKIDFFTSKTKEITKGYVEIKFKDTYLYYKDSIRNQILMNGLSFAKPEKFDIDEFNGSFPYDEWISTVKKISTSTRAHFKNTMKITLSILLDPITQEILEHLEMPTNMLDLLLYTNSMLADNNYRPIGNVLNYRLRNYEQIAGLLNEILLKAYISYLNGYLRGNTRNQFNVTENALIMALTKASSVNPYSALSPVLELETYSRTSQKGFMGLESSASYSKEMREFDDNKLSVYSAGATSFGGSVGITRSLTYNPHIKGIRGYINEIENIETTKDASMLSASELLSPFLSRHSDASRQAMTIGQFKHNMPVNDGSVRLWSSGLEKIVPGLLSSDFIFRAKEDGKVELINKDQEIAKLTYKNGQQDFIDLSASYIRNSANAFYTPNKLIMKLKQGESFKKDDVIAYNDVFFKDRDGRVELLVGTLAKVAIAPIDNSFEDGTIITEKLSKKGTSRVVIPELISLTPTSHIKMIKKIGDEVDETTSILDYDDFGDNSIDGFLSQSFADRYADVAEIIPSSSRFPNFHGTITDIEVFYNVDKEELHESLIKLIDEYGGKYKARLDFVGEQNQFKLNGKMPVQQNPESKEEGHVYSGVMIKVYIQSNIPMGIGDKLSFDGALKGVISNVLSEENAPVSEYSDDKIEAILTPTGVFSRMTHDVFYLLASNKILVELGRQIGKIRDE